MNLGLQLNVGVRMEQKLSPQMIQSLKLLQVNSLQLEALVQQELDQNPILEIDEDVEDEVVPSNSLESKEVEAPDKAEKELKEETSQDDPEIDWEEYFHDAFDLGYQNMESQGNREDVLERPPTYGISLQDSLEEQIQGREIQPEIEEIVKYLINSLDDYGYLRLSPEELAKDSQDLDGFQKEIDDVLRGKLELESASLELREAWHILCSLEPTGIGARNLQECLLLQARQIDDFPELALKILEECWDLLEKLKIAVMAKRLNCEPAEIQAALKSVSRLNPKPGRTLESSTSGVIIPDIIVERVEGELIAYLNDRNVPRLRISKAYSGLLQEQKKKKSSPKVTEERKFIKEKLNSANWLIKSIDQRKSTMLKVMNAIMRMQPDFFEKGPNFLRPLILQDIAEQIEMHISTVNRVTNGKYVQTEFGVFELKHFFSAGVTQEDGSEISSARTKAAIRELIEAENPKKPLSDQKIVDALKAKSLKVARRTVAKYREQMNILPARMRKKF